MNRTLSGRLLLLASFLLAPAGCTQQASVGHGSDSATSSTQASDPWQTAVAELRKHTDVTACQRVLSQLNADLTGKTSAPAPEPMPDDAARKLADDLKLTDDEVREVRGASYTALDASYLADALYLRDTARSLQVQELPVERQAAAAFAWVCRQVYLRHWELKTPDGRQALGPPLPPLAVLRRGYGTGLERAYVFLALLQQLGVDACLVGPPGQERAVTQKLVDGKPWKGPFWAVGVPVGGDMVLFDPFRGEPVPGPGGKGVGTIGQLKKTPDQVKAWRDDKTNPWDVSQNDIENAVGYVAVPISALSLRVKLLETQLAAVVGVKLAADPRALAHRLTKGGIPVAVWAPPGNEEIFSYLRVLSSFLPKSGGGLLPNDLKLGEQFFASLIPSFQEVRPPDLKSDEAASILMNRLRADFANLLIGSGLLDKVQRGQFNEASRGLVEAEKPFAAAEVRTLNAAEQEVAVRTWVARANEVYQKKSQAGLPENAAMRPAAEAEVAEFWRQSAAGTAAVTDKVAAAAGRAEIGYLMALCKHEQAERAQLRFERAEGRTEKARAEARRAAEDAWVAAKDAWDRFAPHARRQAATHPGRADHARRLADRAARLAANPAADL